VSQFLSIVVDKIAFDFFKIYIIFVSFSVIFTLNMLFMIEYF